MACPQNQFWFVANWKSANKFQWNQNRNTDIFIKKNHPHIMSTPHPPGFDVKRNEPQILNSMNSNTLLYILCKQIQVDVLVQERRNSSALAMESRLFCTNPSKCLARCHWCCVVCTAAQFASCKRRGITAEDEAHIPVTAKMRPDWSRTCKNQAVVWWCDRYVAKTPSSFAWINSIARQGNPMLCFTLLIRTTSSGRLIIH